jgi:hypothetical protein
MVSFDAYWTGWMAICPILKERVSNYTPWPITISTATTASEHNLLGTKVYSLIVNCPSFSTTPEFSSIPMVVHGHQIGLSTLRLLSS